MRGAGNPVRVLVTAASRFGATAEIAQLIAAALAERGLQVDVSPPEDVGSLDTYDAVVLGSAIYVGRWLEPAVRLAERSSSALRELPVWLFSSGPVGDPTRRLVQKMTADPVDLPAVRSLTGAREHRLFAGKLEPTNLRGAQRALLFLFRGLEGDFRDRDEIARWAAEIADEMARMSTPARFAR